MIASGVKSRVKIARVNRVKTRRFFYTFYLQKVTLFKIFKVVFYLAINLSCQVTDLFADHLLLCK